MTHRYENPFETIDSRKGYAKHDHYGLAARVLACAFASAHEPRDVFSALRMARQLDGCDFSGWIYGQYFQGWLDERDPLGAHRRDFDSFDTLRDLANDFLEVIR
jgi:hypothetical protein